VLDGVAVYTWSGSQWTPSGGGPTSSTSTGALRGVAAFNWDGTAWQPAGRAGPDVATPYGVLQGVAMFGWNGSAWAAVGAPSLSLDFMTPGALDPRITFTRASTATYTDSTGTIQTAATNAPRWDYDPVTHQLRGVLIEEARTNSTLDSGNAATSNWSKTQIGNVAPAVTGNQVTAPDGTLSGAARVVYPAVTAGTSSYIAPIGPLSTTVSFTFSIWLRGNAGGENLYIMTTSDGVNYARTLCVLTTQWQRFSVTSPNTPQPVIYCQIGVDLRDGGQSAKPAQTLYVWGAQVEQGAFATSYIPTTAASVTRAQDNCVIPAANMAPWFASPGGSWFVEFMSSLTFGANNRIIGVGGGAGGQTPLFISNGSPTLDQYDGVGVLATANSSSFGSVMKGASGYSPSTGKICLNGGAVASGAMTGGYASLGGFGFNILSSQDGFTTGYIRRVSYWPRVLSDAEMQQVTT
jgi:hypothetical protein